VGGLNAEFARRFGLLQKAVKQAGGDLTIYSGGRDQQKQATLYKAALAKYGSESEARKWVAPPGKSNHDTHAGMKYGLGDGAVASDLRGDLAMAHKLAARYGLMFPLANEAWHVELAGIRGK
jgi:LAS superfamily LD-carboxypeptidase LdcB